MIALMSDVHGNLAALEAVMRRIDGRGVEKILCLGDTAGYYPDVDACCAELQHRDVIAVRGNHDHYLVSGTRSGRSRWADLCIDHQAETVGRSAQEWLAALPESTCFAGIAAVHGGWADPLDEYLVSVDDSYFALHRGRYFASGHTHRPMVFSGSRATYRNPGSVGQPRDGDPRASFAWFDGETFRIERVAYDIGRTVDAARRAGLPTMIAANLDVGRVIGAPR